MAVFLLAIGAVLLIAGAEALVRGASRIATAVGLSPLVVGLTVVAFGTSAPELAVSIGSSLTGQADLALGNVVGSNIFNVLFILGLAAVVAPLVVSVRLVRLDVPLAIMVSGAILLLAADGRVGRLDGIVLVAGIVIYTVALIRQARSDTGQEKAAAIEDGIPSLEIVDPSRFANHWLFNAGLVIGGLALLVGGARWFVQGAVQIARSFGVSELVIGLTIVAGGTSLPELATSVLAGLRGNRDIAVGNVVGSNIFNLLAVLGVSAVVAPEGIPVSNAVLWFDLPVMIVVAVACLPIFFTGQMIARWEGGLFLLYYGVYTTYLILATAQHDALSTFSVAMGAFVGPLTLVTLLILVVREWRSDPIS